MNIRHQTGEVLPVILATITSTTIGGLLFQALGTFLLGIIGALGGYFFIRVVKPYLDKIKTKKNEKKA